MKHNFKIVTFYTPDYEYLREKWCDSVEQYGYEYFCFEHKDQGSWKRNVLMKSDFMLQQLLGRSAYDILWIDVDGWVTGELDLIETLCHSDYDMATRTYKVPEEARRRKSFKKFYGKQFYRERMACSATVWLKNNEKTLEVMDYAAEQAVKNPNCWVSHEDCLNHALHVIGNRVELNYYDLPVEYCYCPKLSKARKEAEYSADINDVRIMQGLASQGRKRKQ